MPGSFSRSLDLLSETWRVLAKDRELLLFPVMSGAVTLIIILSFLLPVIFFGLTNQIGRIHPIFIFAAIYLFYYISYAVVIFFNTGLVTCAAIRLSGGDPTIRDGLSNAFRHLGSILAWAAVAATVGLILGTISQRSGLLGRILIAIIGFVWSLATFLVIPVMIFEDRGVIESIHESFSLLKRTWGENIIANFTLGILYIPAILMMIFCAITPLFGNIWVIFASISITILLIAVAGIFHSTLQGIFITALYYYAKTGEMPRYIRGDMIRNAFAKKPPVL
jgi:hypothetical protein